VPAFLRQVRTSYQFRDSRFANVNSRDMYLTHTQIHTHMHAGVCIYAFIGSSNVGLFAENVGLFVENIGRFLEHVVQGSLQRI